MIAAFLPAVASAQSSNFTLTAKIGSGGAPQKAYLLYQQADKLTTDSAIVEHGTFQFKGPLKDPCLARLVLDHQGIGLWKLGRTADYQLLYLENGNISLTAKDSVKNAVITGSKLNDENAKYMAFISVPDKAIAQLNDEYLAAAPDKKKDQDYIVDLQVRANKIIAGKRALQQQYIRQNPDSYISLLVLAEISGRNPDVTAIEPVYKSLSASVRATATGQAFAKMIAAAHGTPASGN